LQNQEYFNTFGGNPVACAIGNAVLDALEAGNFQQNAHKVGEYFLNMLMRLKPKHKIIGDIRGLGLYIGVEFVLDHEKLDPATQFTKQVTNLLKDKHRILTGVGGRYNNVLRMKPPLCFTEANVDHFIICLESVLHELSH